MSNRNLFIFHNLNAFLSYGIETSFGINLVVVSDEKMFAQCPQVLIENGYLEYLGVGTTITKDFSFLYSHSPILLNGGNVWCFQDEWSQKELDKYSQFFNKIEGVI